VLNCAGAMLMCRRKGIFSFEKKAIFVVKFTTSE